MNLFTLRKWAFNARNQYFFQKKVKSYWKEMINATFRYLQIDQLLFSTNNKIKIVDVYNFNCDFYECTIRGWKEGT